MSEMTAPPLPNTDRPEAPKADRPQSLHERAMIAIVIVTLAGCCWLLCPPPGAEEGHIPWRPGSALRALTTLMALNFEYPTHRGTDVKWLIQGFGAAAALLVAAAAWYVRHRPANGDDEPDGAAIPTQAGSAETDVRPWWRARPWDLAQVSLVAFTGWMMLSALWSPWPQAALGEGVRQLIVTIWAVALGRTLMRSSVRQASAGMAAVLAITAVIGLWYYFERNPQQRLKFPIGNPIFMAACLLPGITVTLGAGLGLLAHHLRPVPAGDNPPKLSSPPMWAWAIGGAAALAAMSWALKLTDSRGPLLGLAAGLIVGLYFWLKGRARRWLLVAIAVVLLAGSVHVRVFGPPGFIARRLTTVTFRQYAWSYAFSLFAGQPIAGRGQTAYVLAGQQMAATDAQNDPLAFTSGFLLGHAHNEWLEILADLGLVGFTLMAVVLGATFWCAAASVRNSRNAVEKGVAVGLAAALAALVVAESTDVGLRMPGLPVFFYTVLGLIWAQRRSGRAIDAPAKLWSRPLQWIAIAGALLAGGGVATAATEDFKGALADYQVTACIDRNKWDDSLAQAARAGANRLSVEARLSAAYYYNLVAYLAAEHRWGQMRDMLARLEQAGRIPPGAVQLAKEDSTTFDYYAGQCVQSGQQLLARMPAYPAIAGRIAETLLLRQQVDVAEQRLGLRQDVRPFVQAAWQWMKLEHDRDPTDPLATYRLLQLSQGRPPAELIDLLREVLRGGPQPIHPDPPGTSLFTAGLSLDLFVDFEPVIASFIHDKEYIATIDRLVAQARPAVDLPPSAWPDRFVPETLRLAARDRKLTRRFAEAAEFAALAAQAATRITDRFPALTAYALIDRTRYVLLADPNEPTLAVEACRQAIAHWPASADRRMGLALRRSLALYLLAAGDETGARQQIASLDEPLVPPQLDRLVGMGLGELCLSVAGAFSFEDLPPWLPQRLTRSLELTPDWPVTRRLAATLALARHDSTAAIGHLKAMEAALNSPDQTAAALQAVGQQFPQDKQLQAFIKERLATRPSTATSEAPEHVPVPVLPFPASPATASNPASGPSSIPAGPAADPISGGNAQPSARTRLRQGLPFLQVSSGPAAATPSPQASEPSR